MQCEVDGALAADLFRRRMSFLGLVGIAFTCCVYLMILLRPVLEPFMWALFLVIALRPLAAVFESLLLCLGRLCGCGKGLSRQVARNRCVLRGSLPQDVELPSLTGDLPSVTGSEGAGDLWRVGDGTNMETFCTGCCAVSSRACSVVCALVVVMAVMAGFAMFVFDGAIRVSEDFAIYEQGARNTVNNTKVFIAHVFGKMPRSVVDEISEKMLVSAKKIASDLLSGVISQMGKVLLESGMMGLYVMFWLCTPMPLNTTTELIFQRYFLLKGSACICYGVSIGVMLHVLHVELAAVFGLMSFLLSFIPEVGTFIAMILPLPVILFDSRLEAPFVTLLIATMGQLGLKFVFTNIIEVKLIENDATMKMHPVITLLAVTFFGFVWGPTGMLLSVPMMTYLKAVLLSDFVPATYRDPILVLLEGSRRAPERYLGPAGRASRLRLRD